MNNLILSLYLLTSLLWAIYALKQHIKYFGYSFWRVALCFILDFLLCPLGIAAAIFWIYIMQEEGDEEYFGADEDDFED